MKNIVIVLALLLAGFTANAQVKKNKNAKFVTEVNGNCEQCQRRIQKAAFGVAGVKSAVWNIETHQLSLILNEEKCTPLDVKKAIAKAGHDTDEVKAITENYEKLPSCCLYVREK
ncbi:heavy-metal-associated domain-containing protein [Flavobacterium restrictum]|uniref:Metal transporter n=1 Tax=Flavobacterium restrictum TaxID=2594428 RepID=A0A553EAX6_9FLAO|nr:cation transporter [Flavobacterium restrictum]TRX42219.1 metal transporter [Flavobacterium restrictum]